MGLVVVESVGEARRREELAAAQGVTQPVLLRVNPAFRSANSCKVRADGASCDTLKPIAMNGQGASKFGVDEEAIAATLAALLALKHLEFRGIHVFTESNVLEYRQLLEAWQNTAAIAHRLRDAGIPVHTLDFGGGIGIAYNALDGETNFALHPYPAEVAVAGGELVVIRDRGTYDDFFVHQKLVEI